MARLAGKVACITGGGGGIGRANAERFPEEGARVVVADIATRQQVRPPYAPSEQGGPIPVMNALFTLNDPPAQHHR